VKEGSAVTEKNNDAIIQADLLLSDEDSNFDFFGGERGFYTLASLALGKILRTAPSRQTVVTERCKKPFRKHAPFH
jgi:hypothetical protein